MHVSEIITHEHTSITYTDKDVHAYKNHYHTDDTYLKRVMFALMKYHFLRYDECSAAQVKRLDVQPQKIRKMQKF